MQMLAAGGMPVVGEFPAYEDERARTPGFLDFVRLCDGLAVKILDPFRFRLPFGPAYRAIWLRRNHTQQARSQIKFLINIAGVRVSRDAVQRFASRFPMDEAASLDALSKVKADLHFFDFESLLSAPRSSAERMARLFDLSDVDSMVRQVRARPVTCAKGLDLELDLLRQGAVA
jgi:hypothetical protein